MTPRGEYTAFTQDPLSNPYLQPCLQFMLYRSTVTLIIIHFRLLMNTLIFRQEYSEMKRNTH